MKAGRRIPIRIDMTPMVDVAFLLLIYFMTTTQFKPPEIAAVTLPKSRSEIHVPESKTIIVTVTDEGSIFIATEKGQGEEVKKEDFYNAITQVLTPRGNRPVLPAYADRTATVTQVFDAFAGIGN